MSCRIHHFMKCVRVSARSTCPIDVESEKNCQNFFLLPLSLSLFLYQNKLAIFSFGSTHILIMNDMKIHNIYYIRRRNGNIENKESNKTHAHTPINENTYTPIEYFINTKNNLGYVYNSIGQMGGVRDVGVVVCTFFVRLVKCRNSIEIKTKLIRFSYLLTRSVWGFCLFKAFCQFQFHFISFERVPIQSEQNRSTWQPKRMDIISTSAHNRLACLQIFVNIR